MPKVLLAVDGSDHALHAVKHFVDHLGWWRDAPEIHLLTVHLPVPMHGRMPMVVSKEMLNDYYREEGTAALASAKQVLEAAGLHYESFIEVGQPAETIAQHAAQKGCELIWMGARGAGAVAGWVLGSVAAKVLRESRLPVMLVR
jgi:nucleotide-binding universal stress UspA family protein